MEDAAGLCSHAALTSCHITGTSHLLSSFTRPSCDKPRARTAARPYTSYLTFHLSTSLLTSFSLHPPHIDNIISMADNITTNGPAGKRIRCFDMAPSNVPSHSVRAKAIRLRLALKYCGNAFRITRINRLGLVKSGNHAATRARPFAQTSSSTSIG